MKIKKCVSILITLVLLKTIITKKLQNEKSGLLNLRKTMPFSLMRFQEGNKKELSDSEKLDRIDIELKFGKGKGSKKGQKDKESIRMSGIKVII